MIVVSYWTDDRYARYAERLTKSLVRLGIRHDVGQMKDLGSWQKNTHAKPDFLLNALDHYPDEEAVLWLDADAAVLSPLAIFDETSFDVGVYRYRPSNLYHSKEWHNFGTLFNGTLYLKNSEFSRKILRAWKGENERHPERLDQKNLATVLSKVEETHRLFCLPPEYCWIERLMRPHDKDLVPVVYQEGFTAGHREEAISEVPLLESLATLMDHRILIQSYNGLGDAFYMRPVIRRLLAQGDLVWVETAWPQLFKDIKRVNLLRPLQMMSEPQRDNAALETNWALRPPDFSNSYFLTYQKRDYDEGLTVPGALFARARLTDKLRPGEFTFKPPEEWLGDPWIRKLPRPLGIVRPPTCRREWKNASRNPKTEYIQELVSATPWINWVVIQNLIEGEEWLNGPPLEGVALRVETPLRTESLVALVASADCVLAGPSFMLPMAAAIGTPVFVVFGGYVPPGFLIDPAMGKKIRYAAPEIFCACFNDSHDCSKEIDTGVLRAEFEKFLAEFEV